MRVRMCWLSVWTMHQFVRLYGRVCERVCVEYACVCVYILCICYVTHLWYISLPVQLDGSLWY